MWCKVQTSDMDRRRILAIHLNLLFLHLCVLAMDSSTRSQRATYLVLMEGDSAAFLTPHQHVHMEYDYYSASTALIESHNRILEKSLEVGSYDKLYSFHHVINGFAVHTMASQATRLESADGVVLVEKDRGVKLMTTYTPHFLDLPEKVWKQQEHGGWMKNAGEGIVIGFVDTGINPTHPSFSYYLSRPPRGTPIRFNGTCDVGPMFPIGSCNGKIVSARHFWTGAAKILPVDSSMVLSPFDQSGHGSHVASIAAGNKGVPVIVNGFNYGFASGMAPRARIAVYKAIYPEGGSLADVISAIDQAVKDGVDVLSLSIGPDDPPEDTPIFMNIFELSLLFARRAGVFVAQAAGNKGPGRSTVVSYSPWSLGVASCSTHRTYTSSPGLVLGDGTYLTGSGLSGPTFGDGTIPFRLIAAKDAVVSNTRPEYAEECQHAEALKPMVVRGSIVICNFSTGFVTGKSTILTLINTAKALGFMGFVFVTNPRFGDLAAEPLPFDIPGIIIPNAADVKILMDYYEKQTDCDRPAVASILEVRVASFDDEVAVSRFSSRGPDIFSQNRNPADVLKPDILAPGHDIWAAWSPMSVHEPFFKGHNFMLTSGTSMAAPHVSGIAALIKQMRPTWTPSMISSSMSTTASKYDHKNGRPIMSQDFRLNTFKPSTPFDYGAGLINPSKSLDPGLVLPVGFEDYVVGFLCSLPEADMSRIRRTTGIPCSSNTVVHSTDLNLPSITVSCLNESLLVRRVLMNVAEVSETYVTSIILPPGGVNVGIRPSIFTISPQGSQVLQIMLSRNEDEVILKGFGFGEIILTGCLDHIVRLPLSVKHCIN